MTRMARCYGYENARDTKKGATVLKQKPLSKDLYYIIKETTMSLF